MKHFSLRIEEEPLKKLRCIAKYNKRSATQELQWLINMYIKQFEKEHGAIEAKNA
ncbi:hypothetical protein [Clostridium sp. D33t1_170424_F3]|uniref:hypothetical protein n=1 Tax=Clostridium sp. D33t1_170424_F3 TaxID=2787099 RepID=UPI0018A9B4E2|nr:hypothetical protein [Clostridium sp. D33t1_170424_F3]